jgi:hypothetical protein
MSTARDRERTEHGAVDFNECPRSGYVRSLNYCECGHCAVCGFPKHTTVHGPSYGQPPGSEPYDHQYVAATAHQGEP